MNASKTKAQIAKNSTLPMVHKAHMNIHYLLDKSLSLHTEFTAIRAHTDYVV